MSVAGAAGAMIFATIEDTRRRREQEHGWVLDNLAPPPSTFPSPCGETQLAMSEKCQLGLPAWHSWLDNWPELKKIQDDWFEAFPPTKERSRGRPQDEAPKHL